MTNDRNEWTAMFFIANDNDLGAFTQEKINEIASLGSTDVANVIVQFDTPGKSAIRRMFLKKGCRTSLPGLLPETNTGDKEVLIEFVNRTRSEFPSRRSMLVISNHGTGLDVEPTNVHMHHAHHAMANAPAGDLSFQRGAFRNADRRPATVREIRQQLLVEAPHLSAALFPAHALRSVASDFTLGKPDSDPNAVELTADDLDNRELKAALTETSRRGGIFDVLAFEACLMNTFEVAYQLRDAARFIVGSQSNIPAPGWKFTPILQTMQDATLSNAAFVKTIVDAAVTQIVDDQYAAMSALDLAKAEALAEAISVLAEVMMSALHDSAVFEAITLAHFGAQAFTDSETVDLFDFCAGLRMNTSDSQINEAATNVQNVIKEFVVHANPRGAVVENARGVSIFFPKRDHISAAYRELDFARETSWVWFLDAYLEKLFPQIDEPDFEEEAETPLPEVEQPVGPSA